MKVDWKRLPKDPRKIPEPMSAKQESPLPQLDRKLWYIALGRHIDDQIRIGQVESLAQVARMCGVSRARISQLF